MDVLAQHALQLTRLPTMLQQKGDLSHTVADGDGDGDIGGATCATRTVHSSVI